MIDIYKRLLLAPGSCAVLCSVGNGKTAPISRTLMVITWYGYSCFKIDAREATLAFDPFSKTIGLTPPRFQTDIVLVSHEHPNHTNTETFPGQPTLIRGPGEYETKGIAILGIPTFHDATSGHERGLNTIYRIRIPSEEIVFAHLGDFGEKTMREETVEALGDVDVLFIPVGGTHTLDGETAAKIVNQIEPRLVVPMHYHLPGMSVKLAPVEDFLKAYGVKDAQRSEKLVIKKKDLPEDETRTMVLTVG